MNMQPVYEGRLNTKPANVFPVYHYGILKWWSVYSDEPDGNWPCDSESAARKLARELYGYSKKGSAMGDVP